VALDPADFYTGLVADLYRPLRGGAPNAEHIAKFIARHGQPALELGCGDGDPILELRAQGFDVDGIDSSPDMIERCRARAAQLGITVDVYVQRMETLQLDRTYASIYLAGGTFMLLPDDATASQALARLYDHLTPEGTALIPLFIPDPTAETELNKWRSDTDEQGRTIRFSTIATRRDEAARTHTAVLRYEREDESTERDFTLHWYSREQFSDLAQQAGLQVARVMPDDPASPAFAFWLTR
jgi:SAM-dependent methyltransferase